MRFRAGSSGSTRMMLKNLVNQAAGFFTFTSPFLRRFSSSILLIICAHRCAYCGDTNLKRGKKMCRDVLNVEETKGYRVVDPAHVGRDAKEKLSGVVHNGGNACFIDAPAWCLYRSRHHRETLLSFASHTLEDATTAASKGNQI